MCFERSYEITIVSVLNCPTYMIFSSLPYHPALYNKHYLGMGGRLIQNYKINHVQEGIPTDVNSHNSIYNGKTIFGSEFPSPTISIIFLCSYFILLCHTLFNTSFFVLIAFLFSILMKQVIKRVLFLAWDKLSQARDELTN